MAQTTGIRPLHKVGEDAAVDFGQMDGVVACFVEGGAGVEGGAEEVGGGDEDGSVDDEDGVRVRVGRGGAGGDGGDGGGEGVSVWR